MVKDIPFEEIIDIARLAPSGDNLQPWRFSVDNNEALVLLYQPSEIVEPDYFETGVYCSMGIMLEYISLAANSLGFKATFDIESDFITSSSHKVATITFSPDQEIDNKTKVLVEAMPKRRTARETYLKQPLPNDLLKTLENSVEDEKAKLTWVTDKNNRRLITKFLSLADKQFWSTKVTRQALIQSVYAKNEDPDRDFGMPTDVLNAGPVATPVLKKLFLLAEKFTPLFISIHLKSTQDIRKGIDQSAAIGFLYVPQTSTDLQGRDWSGHDHMVGGRVVARLWLSATANDLSLQPLYHFVAMDSNQNNPSLGNSFDNTVKAAISIFNKIIPTYSERSLVFAFRIGYSKTSNSKKATTPRYALDKILKK